MLTAPPILLRMPSGPVEGRPNSIQGNRIMTTHLIAALGSIIDVAAFNTGWWSSDVAEWAGTLLIRWAEQERAAIRERMTAAE